MLSKFCKCVFFIDVFFVCGAMVGERDPEKEARRVFPGFLAQPSISKPLKLLSPSYIKSGVFWRQSYTPWSEVSNQSGRYFHIVNLWLFAGESLCKPSLLSCCPFFEQSLRGASTIYLITRHSFRSVHHENYSIRRRPPPPCGNLCPGDVLGEESSCQGDVRRRRSRLRCRRGWWVLDESPADHG